MLVRQSGAAWDFFQSNVQETWLKDAETIGILIIADGCLEGWMQATSYNHSIDAGWLPHVVSGGDTLPDARTAFKLPKAPYALGRSWQRLAQARRGVKVAARMKYHSLTMSQVL